MGPVILIAEPRREAVEVARREGSVVGKTVEERASVYDECCDTGEGHTAIDGDSPAVAFGDDSQSVFVGLCHAAYVRRIRRTRQRRIRRSRGLSTWAICAA